MGAGEEFVVSFSEFLHEVQIGKVKLEEDPDFPIRHMLPPPQAMIDALSSGWEYVIAYTPEPRLVTSDVPVVARSGLADFFGVIPEVGLANASELWMPFDPHHALLLTRDRSCPIWIGNIAPSTIRLWNHAIADASNRWTIWRPNSVARQYVNLPN